MTKAVLDAIAARFDLEQSEVQVTSIDIDHDEQKIRIELVINSTKRPEALAKSYFGLTGKVREALGSDWSNFFPVINPKFNSGIHA
ncbi:hypothetical protein [Sulfitobacter pontiacus]|uniref:hypothetical protein n=1 Tax=Sulfitobacter pontiacus TaxID=60137 RepID=UPI00315A355E